MCGTHRQNCTAACGGPVRWWASWLLRAPRWPILLPAVLLLFAYFWVYRSPTVSEVAVAYHERLWLSPFLFGLLALLRGVQLLVRRVAENGFGIDPAAQHPRRWVWPWLLGLAVATYLMVLCQVPMQVGFRISRPALDSLADEALADPANAHALAGRWAGIYYIDGVEVIGNTVVLYIGEVSGNYGFVRAPAARGDVILNSPREKDDPRTHHDFPPHENFNDPEGRRMADDWFVMYSWYWRNKVGWS